MENKLEYLSKGLNGGTYFSDWSSGRGQRRDIVSALLGFQYKRRFPRRAVVGRIPNLSSCPTLRSFS